jgi:DNA cross-link repair 1A protein
MSHIYPGFIIRSSTIAVDYWPKNHPDVTHYFLTHAHSDHTKGLNHDWNGPVIYCSSVRCSFIFTK